MRIPKRIVVLAGCVAIATTIGSILAYRTAKWALVGAQPRSKPHGETPSFLQFAGAKRPTGSASEGFLPTQIGAVMGQEFDGGKIPPLVATAVDPDAAAQELAAKVALKHEQSGSALIGACKLPGFNIQDENGGTLLGARNSGQGIGFPASEVSSIAKLYVDGLHITLSDLSDTFTQNMPGFKRMPFAKLLVAGAHRNLWS